LDTEELLKERQKTHGEYHEFAYLAQTLKFWVRCSEKSAMRVLSSEHRESVDMILHKIARIVTGDPNHKDHWDDIAGYATLGARYVRPRNENTGTETSKQQVAQAENKPLGQGTRYSEIQAEKKRGQAP
jgi:hypothetical protein